MMTMSAQIRPEAIDILIAEDSPTQAEKLRMLLVDHGFRVRVAGNGREALAAAQVCPPTLLITDIVMPEMDGYTLCAALKADTALKAIPVIMVTSLAGIQDIARSLECGADNFIRKPYEPDMLLARIEYILLNQQLRKSSRTKMGMEVHMGGCTHFIDSGREQIIDLLIATYEEAIHMNEALQRQQDEISRSNTRLEVLYGIAAELNRVSSGAREICEQALQGLLQLPEFSAAWIFCADEAPGQCPLAACRLPQELAECGALDGDCRCLRLLRDGGLDHGAAVVECERLSERRAASRRNTHASVPLSVGPQRLGLMNVLASAGATLGSDELQMLEAVASQLALALQRAQLHEHLEALVAQRTAALQAEVQARTRAQARVASLNRIYAVLSGINATIVRVHDRLELFREACRIAVELGKFHLAWIGLIEPEAQRVKPLASHCKDGETVLPDSLALDEGLFSEAVKTRQAVTCSASGADADGIVPAAAREAGCRAMAILPLLRGEGVEGLLTLYSTEPEVFDETEMRLLRELAGDIAFALEYIRKSEQVDYLAYYDALTGLPNRKLIHDRLDQLLQAAEREQGAPRFVAVVLINIERFKNINDSLGRQRGDALLKLVAQRLEKGLRASDSLARIGGDHFAAILAGLGDAADAAHRLEKSILPDLAQPFELDSETLHIAVKVGVAVFPGDGSDADTLFANAETALAKSDEGEERYVFYAPQMNARVSDQLALENKLHRALERSEFVLYYQPKVSLQSGQIVGLEALIRWQDPEIGLVSPLDFIPLLEKTGLIVPVGRWALEQALQDCQGWLAEGLAAPRVAVNVSAVQMRRRSFLDSMQTLLGGSGSEHGGLLDIELTESLLMTDIAGNVRSLQALREMGLRIAVDDFGTGYSSLSYLQQFPIDFLKIDQSFVRNISSSPAAAAICVAVIALAHSLGLEVIAEGVENDEQMDYLRSHGCDEMQGFLFSQPVPAALCEAMLKERRTFSPGGR